MTMWWLSDLSHVSTKQHHSLKEASINFICSSIKINPLGVVKSRKRINDLVNYGNYVYFH